MLNKRISAQAEIDKAINNTLPTLDDLLVRLASADATASSTLLDADPNNDVTSAQLQKQIFDELFALQQSGDVPSQIDVDSAAVNDRQNFQTIVNNFETSMTNKVNNCTPGSGGGGGGKP